MKIVDLTREDKDWIHQTAILLQESFEAWSTYEMARDEVIDSLQEERISRVLLSHEGEVIGWIGGQSQYGGNVWELQPLVIRKAHPANFYLKLGYVIVGIIPDANGMGKPDILMAKRVE